MSLRSVNIAFTLAAAVLVSLTSSAVALEHDSTTLAVEPAEFSPNGDGHLDTTTVTVTTDLPAMVRIEILDLAGRVVRTWTVAVAPNTPGSVVWDGTIDGRVAPDQTYRVRASGERAGDLVEEIEVPVTVDTRAPKVTSAGKSPILTTQHEVSFHFRITDNSALLLTKLEVEDDQGVVDHVERGVSSGRVRIPWRPESAHGHLFPGTYFAELTVLDAAGNQTGAKPIPWRVHSPARARVWREVAGSGRRVAITIDDCHFATAWSKMLTTLRRTEAGATFFCPGEQILANPELARRTIRDGHDIGSHGWDHARLTALPKDGVVSRLRKDADALWQVARRTTAPYMRPPYGAVDHSVLDAAGETAHPRVILWDVDPQDWRRPGTATIVSRVLHAAHAGSIVLLHTLPQSAEALPSIISGLRRRGLEPVGLPELFDAARAGGDGH